MHESLHRQLDNPKPVFGLLFTIWHLLSWGLMATPSILLKNSLVAPIIAPKRRDSRKAAAFSIPGFTFNQSF